MRSEIKPVGQPANIMMNCGHYADSVKPGIGENQFIIWCSRCPNVDIHPVELPAPPQPPEEEK